MVHENCDICERETVVLNYHKGDVYCCDCKEWLKEQEDKPK